MQPIIARPMPARQRSPCTSCPSLRGAQIDARHRTDNIQEIAGSPGILAQVDAPICHILGPGQDQQLPTGDGHHDLACRHSNSLPLLGHIIFKTGAQVQLAVHTPWSQRIAFPPWPLS
jgi:hypothetical protein